MFRTALIVIGELIIIELVCQVAAYLLMPAQFESQIARQVADPEIGWIFENCRPQTKQGWGDFSLCFNEQGLRHEEPVTGTVPLLFAGNSVTLGQHVPLRQTFAALAGGVNAGFEGYSVYQLAHWLTGGLLEEAHVEQLVVVVAPSDLVTRRESALHIEATLQWNPMIRRTSALLNLARKEGLYRLYMWRRGSRVGPGQQDERLLTAMDGTSIPEALADWSNAILQIRDAVGPTRFSLVLSPPRSQVVDFRETKKSYVRNQQIAAFCAKSNIPFLDLLEVVSGEETEEIFVDAMHYTRAGHEIVATRIKEFLLAKQGR